MGRKTKQRLSADIETGSMSDISFLLIIFFILTTTLAKPTGRLVEVPSAAPPDTQTKSEEDKTPQINVFPDRITFALGGKGEGDEVSFPELKGELLKLGLAAKPPKERMVVVEVGEDVEWDRYFKVVTLVAEVGGVVALVEGEGG